jgi:hypothetical protein
MQAAVYANQQIFIHSNDPVPDVLIFPHLRQSSTSASRVFD